MNAQEFAVLNVPLVRAEIEKRGLLLRWVIEQLGLTRSSGHALLSDGVLPKDKTRQGRVVRKLAQLLDLEPASLVIRVGDTTAAKTA
jgi:hypothetical protein